MKYRPILLIGVTAALIWSFLAPSISAQEIIENSLSGTHNAYFSQGSFVSVGVEWVINVADQNELDNYVAQTYIVQFVFPGDEAMLSPDRFADGVDCTALTSYEACIFFDSNTIIPCAIYVDDCGASHAPTMIGEDTQQAVSFSVSWFDPGSGVSESRWLSDDFGGEINEKGIPSVRVLTVTADGDVNVLDSAEIMSNNTNGYTHGSFNAEYVPNEGVVLTYDLRHSYIWQDIVGFARPYTLIRKQLTNDFAPIVTTQEIVTATQAVAETSSALSQLQNESAIFHGIPSQSPAYPLRTVDSDVSAGDTIYYQLNAFQPIHPIFLYSSVETPSPLPPLTGSVGWGSIISITIPMTAASLPTFEFVEASFTVQKTGSTYEIAWDTTAEPNIEQFGIGAFNYTNDYWEIAPIITTIVPQGGDSTGASYTLSLSEMDVTSSYWSVDSLQLYRIADDGYPILIANASVSDATALAVSLHRVEAAVHSIWALAAAVGLIGFTAYLHSSSRPISSRDRM